MKRHIASVHDVKMAFKCDSCNRDFTENSKLKQHIASVHEGKKPFTCDLCNRNFANNSNLTKHIASVHEGTKKSECKICDRQFKSINHNRIKCKVFKIFTSVLPDGPPQTWMVD